jgi:hypothetical protein
MTAAAESRGDRLPGQDLVEQGLADLRAGANTECALLLQVAAPRLRDLGIEVPEYRSPQPAEHALYELLEQRLGPGAHSQYNSLIRRIVSYARARDREVRLGAGPGRTKR